MLQDVGHRTEQMIPEGPSSPIGPHMFDFYDHSLFQETLQNSEVSSCSGCCYEENTSFANDLCFTSFPSDLPGFAEPSSAAACNTHNTNLSVIQEPQADFKSDNVSATLDFPSSMSSSNHPPPPSAAFAAVNCMPNPQTDFDIGALHIPLGDVDAAGFTSYSPDNLVALGPASTLGAAFEEDGLSSLPPYVRMEQSSPSSSSFLDHSAIAGYLPGFFNGGMCPDISGLYHGSIMADSGLTSQELDFQGDNCRVYCSESLYASGDIQVLGDSQQALLKGNCGSSAGLASDMSSLDDQGGYGKAQKCSSEERKEKIDRYMKKRNVRNFSKKIKYECRKTLADSRPRVRGRFAKNDEFGEAARPGRSHHEEDDDDEGGGAVQAVKEEEELMMDSSDILAHISGVNSFKPNFPIPSWI